MSHNTTAESLNGPSGYERVDETARRILDTTQPLFTEMGIPVINPLTHPDEYSGAIRAASPLYNKHGKRIRDRQDLSDLPSDTPPNPWDSRVDIVRDQIGLADSEPIPPVPGHYNVAIAPGGARYASFDRTGAILRAIDAKTITVDKLILAGSTRELTERDREAAAQILEQKEIATAKTEADIQTLIKQKLEADDQFPPDFVELVNVDNARAGTPDIINAVLDHYQATHPDLSLTSISMLISVERIFHDYFELQAAGVGLARHLASPPVVMGILSRQDIVAGRSPGTYLAEIVKAAQAAAQFVQNLHPNTARVARIGDALGRFIVDNPQNLPELPLWMRNLFHAAEVPSSVLAPARNRLEQGIGSLVITLIRGGLSARDNAIIFGASFFASLETKRTNEQRAHVVATALNNVHSFDQRVAQGVEQARLVAHKTYHEYRETEDRIRNKAVLWLGGLLTQKVLSPKSKRDS